MQIASRLASMAPPGARPTLVRPQEQGEPVDRVQLSARESEPSRKLHPAVGLATGLMAALSLAGALATPAQAGAWNQPVAAQSFEFDQFGHGGGKLQFPGQGIEHHHGGNWDRETVEGGWRIPRNESSIRVQPRHAYQVSVGTSDLGTVRVLDNTRGRIQAVRLQWPAESDPRAARAHEAMFGDLLTKLPPDVRFEIVVESGGESALRQLIAQSRVTNPERIELHTMGLRSSREELYQGMSMWSRDGAVVLTRESDGREVVLLPHSFRDDGKVDDYLNRVILQGTGAAPASLVNHPGILVRRSTLDFEGGNVVANGRHVLLSHDTISDNARRLNLTSEQVVARFEAEFGRRVIVAKETDFHLDLGVGFLDDHTVTVASPALARSVSGLPANELETMREVTREKDLQGRYDRLAETLAQKGYQVVRMPNLGGRSLSSPYLTYQNVLIESYQGVKRVYMPVYGASTDQAARQAYEAEGFEVVEIPAALLSTRLGGGVRCAVGELDILQ